MTFINLSKFIIGLLLGLVIGQCVKITGENGEVPSWIKTGGFTVFVLICWDIVRIPIQAWWTKRYMQSNFNKIEKDFNDLEKDVEEALEEE